MLAWLPSILISRGYDAETAGWLLSLSQAAGILGSVSIPYIAGLKKDQRWIVIVLTAVEILSIIGLIFPVFGAEWIWVSLIGFVLGGTFGLSLLFLVLRTSSTDEATELSGMSQSIGYVIAAIGPVLMGTLFDLSGNWAFPLAVLALLTFIKLFMGLGAAKEETV
jgi:CP family cyanate transporter-like MFS transporter